MLRSLTVGVVKLNWWGRPSRRPLTAVAVAAIVTSYLVAYGSGRLASGVKMRMVVPDHRNEPGIAGVTLKNGAVTRAGMLPSVTIGSEKTTRISLASASIATSPFGAALTTRSASR